MKLQPGKTNTFMKTITHSFNYQIFDSETELPPDDRILLADARDAISSSYSPYSQYHVGAAVRMQNGEIVRGSNQENASFPAGSCAERVALFAAASAFPGNPVEAIAITAKSAAFPVLEPVTPCGICRQALVEFELRFQHNIRLILSGEKGRIFIIDGIQALLPLAFMEKKLMKKP